MNRLGLIGSTLGSMVFSFGLVGCDGGGIEEGVPKEIPKTAVVPVEGFSPGMVKQTAQIKAADAANKKAAAAEKKD